MELPKGPHALSLKRQPTKCCDDVRAGKAARVGRENGPSSRNCAHGCCACPMRPTTADVCSNYLNSGVPRRIMFYKRGDWSDFTGAVLQLLIEGFKDEKLSVSFTVGGRPLLFDYLSMVLINLGTRRQRSVAWIDESGKCFFPTFFYDEEDDESAEWLSGNACSKAQSPEVVSACGSPPEVVKCVVVESGASVSQRLSTPADILSTEIEKLERGSEDFLFVQKIFLSGMGPFATAQSIMHIHQCVPKDDSTKVRLENFEKQMSSIKEEHGDANVHYGWFGSNKIDIVGILVHGFGKSAKPTKEAAFGTGIYLTPKNRAFASVNHCDVDEKGLQHMMLCRTILGNMEKVQPGSKQCLPSGKNFHSGVDNLSNPKCYVVWPAHMDSYIHAEYVVSFMLAPKIRDYLLGLKDAQFHVPAPKVMQDSSALRPVRCEPVKGPTSPWISITALFDVIKNNISPLAKELLYHHHEELKRKIITRGELVKKMRLIVGDQLIVSTLKQLQHNPSAWYDNSAAKSVKPFDSASLPMPPIASAAEKMKPMDLSAMKPNESAAPTIDLNYSAVTPNELADPVVTIMEPTHSNAPTFRPDGSASPSSDPSGC